MHKSNGKLRGVTITCHNEYLLPCFLNGLKPSVHSPSYIFILSYAKSRYIDWKYFHTSASEGCVISPSIKSSACYLIGLDVRSEWYILFNISVNGKYHNYLYGTELFRLSSDNEVITKFTSLAVLIYSSVNHAIIDAYIGQAIE